MEKKHYERPVIQHLNTGLMNKFGTRTEYMPVTHIDGTAVDDLIKAFGSPVFVLSEKTIRDKYREFLDVFKTRYPKVQFAWSYKTNYLNAVCNVYHQEGSWAEVVSGFEYQKALNNSVPGTKIIFNGPDKTSEELHMAAKNQSLIHIDHLDELYTLVEITDKEKLEAKVAIRVNMDTGIYPMWDRFGFNYENGQAWDAINKIMVSENLKLVGLHCHIGTFMLAPNAYAVAASKLAALAIRTEKKFGQMVQYIDMGGGLPSKNNLKGAYLPGQDMVPPIEDFAEAIATGLLDSDIPPDKLPLLIMESGRALIDDAGYLLGTVIANKRLSNGRRATIMDFGVNILFTSFWYNHRISPAKQFGHHTEDMELFGPLCMNIDVVRESVTLPMLDAGDHVVVHQVGAYNMTQWMQFITMRPNVVMLDLEGKPHLVREKENLEYINSMERLPEHLKEFEL